MQILIKATSTLISGTKRVYLIYAHGEIIVHDPKVGIVSRVTNDMRTGIILYNLGVITAVGIVGICIYIRQKKNRNHLK